MIDNLNKNLDVNAKKIFRILRKADDLTITDIVRKSKFSRATARIALAKLEGADKVFIRKVGMAKLYSLRKEDEKRA